MKTQILKITLIALSTLLSVNICKAQQYISSNSTTGYACYNYFDNNTAANITPTPVGSTTAAIILPAASANNLSIVGTSGSCLESNQALAGQPAIINFIPNSADQTTYAANLNTKDWEWSLLFKAGAATGQTTPSGSTFYTPLTGITTNAWRYWLMATSNTIVGGTTTSGATAGTKGFVLMQTSDGYLRVYAADGDIYDNPALLVSSKAALTTGTTYCIKIQRLISGVWTMFLDPYTSTVTQAQTIQQTTNSDSYTTIITSAYKNSILEATQSTNTAGTFKFDEMHMYSRYLVFNPLTTQAQGITPSPIYANEQNVILYGLQILMRGNYTFSQLYINMSDPNFVRGDLVNGGQPASLYITTNPVVSLTGATFVSNIQLNNGTGAQAIVNPFSTSNNSFVTLGNTDGSLSNPGNYFIVSSVINTNPLPDIGTITFGSVASVVDATGNNTAITPGNYSNGTATTASSVSTGTTFDWLGGSGSGSTLNSWAVAANWVQNAVPGSSDIANFGVNNNFQNSVSPHINATTTVGQINIGKNGGNTVTFNLYNSKPAGQSLTTTNGMTIAAGSNFALQGASASSRGTFITQGSSTAASTSIITPSDVNWTQSGTFTLNSDATGSANIGIYVNTTITGTFNIQRYFTANRTWRLLSSPINNATGTFKFSNLMQNLILTGSGGNASGFDPQPSWNATGYTANGPTVLFYNESVSQFARNDYSALTTNPSSTSANVGSGFYFFYRGDRTHNLVNKIERVSGSYATPEATQGLWTGSLNSGNITFSTSYTAHTGASDDGYNLVGNPYACTLDWTKIVFTPNTFVIDPNTSVPEMWGYDPTVNSTNPAGVGNVTTNIAMGQGVFVRASATGGVITFTENAKDVSAIDQPTVKNTELLFSLLKPATNPYMQFAMIRDSANADFAKITFNNKFSPKYSQADDIDDVTGDGQNVLFGSMTADSVEVALNGMPLNGPKTSFFLSVNATTKGAFSIKRTDMVNISSAYNVTLMDHFTGDSLDLRQNDTYPFNITSDAKSYGNNRFEVILRIKPLPPYKLLAFTGQHVSDGNQLNWKTENEFTYTTFQLQKSIDGGKTFNSITTMQSDSLGQYTYTDKSTAKDTSMYRLMQADVNNNITYSSIVIISTTGSLVDFKVYPNPASSYIQFQANSVVKPPLKLNIYNSIGSIVKSATFSVNNGTQDLSGLINGTYILEIIDVNTKKSLGTAKFSKF